MVSKIPHAEYAWSSASFESYINFYDRKNHQKITDRKIQRKLDFDFKNLMKFLFVSEKSCYVSANNMIMHLSIVLFI